jgi:hypothetical protein
MNRANFNLGMALLSILVLGATSALLWIDPYAAAFAAMLTVPALIGAWIIGWHA